MTIGLHKQEIDSNYYRFKLFVYQMVVTSIQEPTLQVNFPKLCGSTAKMVEKALHLALSYHKTKA